MHMSDALISPAVGGAMWVATAAATVYCAKKVREQSDESKIPLMGVTGAFVFAAQMLNFTIPGTGSSGHLGGGLILALLLGPEAAFLVMASILTVQALFFADGGLLALGCNIFNLGVFPAFIAFPLYRKIVGGDSTRARAIAGSLTGAIVGLQLGALSVVLETVFSGRSELPMSTFFLLMQPIHLAIGVVEGLATAGVVLFVMKTRPEMLERVAYHKSLSGLKLKPVLIALAVSAVLSGAAFSWFSSVNPDGLEWSIAKVTGKEELIGEAGQPLHKTSAELQEKTAFLPDYGFKTAEPVEAEAAEGVSQWPAVDPGTSVAGLVGAVLTLLFAVFIGFVLQRRGSRPTEP